VHLFDVGFIFLNFWWQQVVAGRNLKIASCRGGWGSGTCPRSTTIHSVEHPTFKWGGSCSTTDPSPPLDLHRRISIYAYFVILWLVFTWKSTSYFFISNHSPDNLYLCMFSVLTVNTFNTPVINDMWGLFIRIESKLNQNLPPFLLTVLEKCLLLYHVADRNPA